MIDNKPSEGLSFMMKLNNAAFDKKELVRLAHEAIMDSHDQRTFVERQGKDLRVNPTSINLGATVGMGHAILNHNLSTNDKLNMVMKKYIDLAVKDNPDISKESALKSFCKDFAKSYPEEYGAKSGEHARQSALNPLLKAKIVAQQYQT